ncbi:MAG: DUF167 domain-containing protein [Alphaproteobacteria bacterium]|nr:DUF167 domain-containing protein [Alphaproteobacteria bacterium]
MTKTPFSRAADGALVTVRLTPKSSANAIRGIAADVDGSTHLKANVTAVPEDGKANAALLKLLAKTWKLPKTSLTIASGATSRNKVVHIAGDPAALHGMLREWKRTIE